MPSNSRENRIKIFVDGNCIVCDREISHYKKIAPDLFDLIDISNPQFNAADFQLDPIAVDRYLHVLLPDGHLAVGIDSFLAIWKALEPRHRFFGLLRRIIAFPLIRPFADIFYWIFARVIRPRLPKKR